MQNMAAPPADSNDSSNPGARSGMPENTAHKVEAEAKDGGARKDNDRAAGNADAMEGDKVSKDKDDKKDGESDDLPGKKAVVHSKLQGELDEEIKKKPEGEWGVTNEKYEKEHHDEIEAVGNENKPAKKGESDEESKESQGSGGLMGKVKHAMHKD